MFETLQYGQLLILLFLWGLKVTAVSVGVHVCVHIPRFAHVLQDLA